MIKIKKGGEVLDEHRIFIRHVRIAPDKRLSRSIIKEFARQTLKMEKVPVPCEINILITGDKKIKKLNNDFRNVNEATDVLAFPMCDMKPGEFNKSLEGFSPETGFFMLGDIVISSDRVTKQAIDIGTSLERETAYLTVHAVLHLLGYDHKDEAEDKKLMRSREKEILSLYDQ